MRRRSNLLLIGRFVLTIGINNQSAMESAYFAYACNTSENEADHVSSFSNV